MEYLVGTNKFNIFFLGAGKGQNPTQSNKNGIEHLIRIDLDVQTLSRLRVVDSFDWDICNPDNVPEEFASMLV